MAGEQGSDWHGASIGAWLATAVIIAGTIVGGIALIEWQWIMFWIGVALFVGGAVAGYFTNIMGAVEEYAGDTHSASQREAQQSISG